MSASQGAQAPEVTMCQHLQTTGLLQPFALYSTKRAARYACPSCITSAIQRRLDQPGSTPADVAASCHFNRCDHQGDNPGRACWVCLEAAVAAITSRWAELFHTDKPSANRLLRIVQLLNRHYNPARSVPRPKVSPRYSELEAAPRSTAEELQEQRTLKALQTMRQNRHARIRQNRSLPEKGAIHQPQAERVTVVSNVA